MADPPFLHPRAVRMGLERVIEHQRVKLTETVPLSQVYEQVLHPPEPLKTAVDAQQLADFVSCDSKAEREDWVRRFLASGV